MSKLKTCLYLDDMRTPTENLPGYKPWEIVRSYEEFINYLLDAGIPDLISFDHDLADEHIKDYSEQMVKIGWHSPKYELYKEKTGLDCAKYLTGLYDVSISMDKPNSMPSEKFPKCVVHSHNPVGAMNILSYLQGYIKHYKLDSVCYQQRFPFIIES